VSFADSWVISLRSARLTDTPRDTAPLSCLCIEKYSWSSRKIQASWSYDSQRTASTIISPHKNTTKRWATVDRRLSEVGVDAARSWGVPLGRTARQTRHNTTKLLTNNVKPSNVRVGFMVVVRGLKPRRPFPPFLRESSVIKVSFPFFHNPGRISESTSQALQPDQPNHTRRGELLCLS
jgi:hypothetical protein